MKILDLFRKKEDLNLFEAFRNVYTDGYEVSVSTDESGIRRIYRTFSLSPNQKKLLAKSVPLLFKGMRKKSRDIFKNWFKIEGEKITDADLQKIQKFVKENDLKIKLIQAVFDAFWEGNGYLELLDNGSIPETEEIKQILGVELINPENVSIEVDLNPNSRNYGKIKWYVVKNEDGKEVKLHPSRVIHFKFFWFGNEYYGRSVIEVAYLAALASMNSTYAYGEYIYRYGHPFPVIYIEGANQNKIKDAWKLIKQISPKTGFVGSEKHKFELLNPAQFDPAEFDKHFRIQIAAALEIPEMMLTGVQVGTVTGSEINRADYYDDIATIQNLIIAPKLERLFSQLIGKDVKVIPNTLWVDEKSEAEVFFKKAQAINLLYNVPQKNGLAPIITEDEARKMLGLQQKEV